MSNIGEEQEKDIIAEAVSSEYKYGFTTDIETDVIERGLNEDIIRRISAKKNEPEWLLEFRLKAYRKWLEMKVPDWGKLEIGNIISTNYIIHRTKIKYTI